MLYALAQALFLGLFCVSSVYSLLVAMHRPHGMLRRAKKRRESELPRYRVPRDHKYWNANTLAAQPEQRLAGEKAAWSTICEQFLQKLSAGKGPEAQAKRKDTAVDMTLAPSATLY